MLWTNTSNDWQIGSNPVYTYASVINTTAGLISSGGGIIYLEHVLREATIQVGITVSGMISKAVRINCPVAAIFGDAQRYQGTNLTWPVVGPNGFDLSINPIKGVLRNVPCTKTLLIDFRSQVRRTSQHYYCVCALHFQC